MLTKLERAPVLAGSLVVLAVFAISVMARHHVVRRHPHHYTIDVTGNHAASSKLEAHHDPQRE